MVLLIAGASHTGKTLLAQRMLERYRVPYLSIDHLKMGLIRSGRTSLTPEDDEALTGLLWPILREMVKTAIENRQHLIVEGCYIPFGWEKGMEERYRRELRYLCLVMSEGYIRRQFPEIIAHAGDIEERLDDSGCTAERLCRENARNLRLCREHGYRYLLIDGEYRVTAEAAAEAAGWCPPAGPTAALSSPRSGDG